MSDRFNNPYESGDEYRPKSPAVREFHPLRFFYMAAAGMALLFAGYLYLWNFNSRSETELVFYSFAWLSLLAGGGLGYLTPSRGVKPGKSLLYALGAAAATPAALAIFYVTIWPAL